jgi:hypothetical protein
MGYNLGGKAAALGLMALADGDRAKAERIWRRIRNADPMGIDEALDLVEAALAEEEDESSE